MGVALGLLAAGLTVAAPAAVTPRPSTAQALPSAQQALLRLPLSFEANQGQFRSGVSFVARAGGRTLAVEPTAAELRMPGAGGGAVVRMQAVDADPHAAVQGTDKLPGVVNHLVGNDPSAWRTNVPTYGGTVTHGVWPGIDLTWYGHSNEFEYDLTLAPGADPAAARFDIAGARSVALTPTGDLAVHTAAGTLTERAPVAYQLVNGVRRPVDAGYRTLGAHRIGFRVGPHDSTLPVVVDPSLAWSTLVGSALDDIAYAIAVDITGASYVTGYTSTSGFTGVGLFSLDSSYNGGSSDVFVTKINAAGTAVVYSTYVGGSGLDTALGIALDAANAVYVTGYTQSPTFTGVSTRSIRSTPYGQDGYLIKLASTGRSVVYSTFLGGTGYDEPRAVAVDASGAAYVTGGTTSKTWTGVTATAIQPTNKGVFNAFLTKVNPAGTATVYSTFLGGTSNDNAASVAVDSTGAAYLTGGTNSSTFPGVGPTSPQSFNAGGLEDGFVSKVNPAGNAVVFSTFLGGTGTDEPIRLVIDSARNVYVTGAADSSTFPGVGVASAQSVNGGGYTDVFVSKLRADGRAVLWSTFLGGPGSDLATGMVLDLSGNVWVAGGTNSPNWKGIGSTSTQKTIIGASDGFITELNPTGTAALWSTYLGQGGVTQALALAVDVTGNIYAAGGTSSPTFTGTTTTSLRSTNPGG
ncbi:MAG TPA: SBBP repeat-containing protein, partial [Sporichthyaceae bacterium]|nr:SBBP repeat-containing protein [Sporichthyaceae bacterium]